MTWPRFLTVLGGIVTFGTLMALRSLAADSWHRVFFAAAAGAALGLTLVSARRRS